LVILYPGGINGPDDPGPTETSKGLRDRIRYGWPRTTGGVPSVDVRDLARIVAACAEAGRGPRRFMAGGHYLPWMMEADICERLTGRRVRRVPAPAPLVRAVGYLVDFVKWIKPSFDYPLTSEAAQFATLGVACDSRATTETLKIEFRPAEETLRDQILWLYDAGELTAKLAGKLANAKEEKLATDEHG
jgi:nucleoside-diphosphate-sugar epimerase